MTEMEMLNRLRFEVPAEVSPRAEHRFHAAFQAELAAPRSAADRKRPLRGPRGLPVLRLAVAAGVAAAAAGIAVAVPHSGNGSATTPRGAAITVSVQELAYHASAAALEQHPVSPGQWVYQKYSSVTTAPKGGHGKSGTTESWQTADGLRTAVDDNGKLTVYATPTEGKDISYVEITKLGLTPQALVKYLYGRELQIQGQEPADLTWEMTFNEIAGLFHYFDLPPKVTAGLFQALARIPGVKVTKANGGVSFTRVGGSLTESVTLDPGTYTVTGLRLAVPGTRITHQISFTPWVPVSGPGDRP